MAKAKPDTVSAQPLFDWFAADRNNRASLRAAGYSDGRITNWKERGIPRAQVGQIATVMGWSYEQYLAAAGERVARKLVAPDGISEEALEIARAFDRMQPQTKERVREHVFLYSVIDKSFPWLRTGKPVSRSYDAFERWHEDNKATQLALEAARISRRKG